MQGKASDAFDVVILYDHFASAGRAMTAFSLLRQELEPEVTLAPRIWRIDVATSAEFACQANEDIKAAEVLILSVRGSAACPAEFLPWSMGAGEGFGLPRRALIALVEADREPADRVGTWSSTLRAAGAHIQRDVFFWVSSAATDDGGERDTQTLAALTAGFEIISSDIGTVNRSEMRR